MIVNQYQCRLNIHAYHAVMDVKTAFGEVLRAHRAQTKLSQEALALECELDRTFISMLERGKRQPTLTTLFRIAEVLKIPASQLIADAEERLKS